MAFGVLYVLTLMAKARLAGFRICIIHSPILYLVECKKGFSIWTQGISSHAIMIIRVPTLFSRCGSFIYDITAMVPVIISPIEGCVAFLMR